MPPGITPGGFKKITPMKKIWAELTSGGVLASILRIGWIVIPK